ncbi:MAG: hypothetical protein R6W96_09080, partial [Clostridia bacterium]
MAMSHSMRPIHEKINLSKESRGAIGILGYVFLLRLSISAIVMQYNGAMGCKQNEWHPKDGVGDAGKQMGEAMMIYTKMTKKAMLFAFNAHKNDVDKGGTPYIFHPFHLAEQMDSEETVMIALLHDVVEDTDLT